MKKPTAGSEAPPPNEVIEKDKEVLDEDVVEQLLVDLQEAEVFRAIRSQIQHGPFFREGGFIPPDDESETRLVLESFTECLQWPPDDRKGLLNHLDEEQRLALIKALEPGSTSRQIILGYYGIQEETPWAVAVNPITTRQSYQDEEFPSVVDVRRVIETSEKSAQRQT